MSEFCHGSEFCPSNHALTGGKVDAIVQ